MHWLLLALALIFACGDEPTPDQDESPPAEPELRSAVPLTAEDATAFLDGVVTGVMEREHIAGAQLALIYRDELLALRGYGMDDIEAGRATDPERTLTRIASISKTFTWAAVAQLVENRQIDLDADVNTYLTAFQIPQAYGEPVRIRHLLTHTPGFEVVATTAYYKDASSMPTLEQFLSENIPQRVRPPGVLSAYSNYGAALAGYIVQQVSGEPFADYVATHITEPLGMHRTGFREPIDDSPSSMPADLAADVAKTYKLKKGEHVADPRFFLSHRGPAGAMTTTASDMVRWMRMWQGDGTLDGVTILKPETVEAMRTRLFGHDVALSGWGWGLADYHIGGHRAYGHTGRTIHYNSAMYLFPSSSSGSSWPPPARRSAPR